MTRRSLLFGLAVIGVGLIGIKGVVAWNARVTPEKIAAGKVLFEHDWTVEDPLCGEGDGLGPVFNARSCVACHFQGGLGGSSGNAMNVVAFEAHADDPNMESLSGVVHKNAISKQALETQQRVRQIFPSFVRTFTVLAGGYDDGGCGSVPAHEQTVQETIDPVVFHSLNSPALFGVGLIDEISNLSVSFQGHKRLANKISEEMSGDFGGNRLGMINMVDGSVGKFGWKGQFSSLEDFVASACAMEIGLTNSMHRQPVPNSYQPNHDAKMDMTRQQLHELVCFVRSLPRPQRIMPTDPASIQAVNRGAELFDAIGCADCHVKDFGGVPEIYSDFHLYNLEPIHVNADETYSDGQPEDEFDFDRSGPHPDQWQTPPLWGVADSAPYFHDGGSSTLNSAILRHQGQAASTLQKFKSLTKRDQQSLIRFLKTLRAPQEPVAEETLQ